MKDDVKERSDVRIKTRILLEYWVGGSHIREYAFCANLSEGGAFIETRSLQPEKAEIVMAITFLDTMEKINVRCMVVWVSDGSQVGKPIGMGVSFDQSDATTKDLIKRHLDRMKLVLARHG